MVEQIKEILQDLGLSDKEAEVYLALLKLGEETASRISQIADLNRITAYVILKNLQEKGFCSVYNKNNVQYFKPIKPEQIVGLLEEKKSKIKAVLPQLKQQERAISEKPEISLYEGKKGIASCMTTLLNDAEKKKEVFGYGNVSISEQVIQYQSLYWRKTRLTKKIKMKAVSDSLGDIEHRSPPQWKKLTEVRTNKEMAKLSTYVIFTENYVGYFMMKGEPYCTLIKSKELSDKERFNFELCWKSLNSRRYTRYGT